MSTDIGGIPRHEFLLVHAAPIEGHGLEDLGVEVLGVGKVAAAVHLQRLLVERPSVRAVLLFGIAGAFPTRHRPDGDAAPAGIGDLVVVANDRLGDEGVATPDGFLDLGSMKLGDVGPFACDPRLQDAAVERLGAARVHGVTVSTCSGIDAASCALQARTGADVESMEGAAVAYLCRQQELPLLQLRAISNWTGDRDRGEWSLGAAVDVVQRAVRTLLTP
ncbi:MAG: futalosine hydrolase [Planctomycetota bacterium]